MSIKKILAAFSLVGESCENPLIAYRLVDFMSSPEAYLRNRWGVPGRDWDYVAEDNTLPGCLGGEAQMVIYNPQLLTEVNNVMWHGGGSGIASEGYWQYTLDPNDGSWKSALYTNLQKQIELNNAGKYPTDLLPVIERTEENDEAYSEANANITTYYKQARANFCNGVIDPSNDNDWNTYVSDLEGLGYYENWIAVAQESWDRSQGLD